VFTPSSKFPGKFSFSYLVSSKILSEKMTATYEGIKFRDKVYASAEAMIDWFKQDFIRGIGGG
jgi:hypothetical protein